MTVQLKNMNLRSVFFISLVIGMAFRIACTPTLSYEYDNYSWAVILQNIKSGSGLYGVDGYFYTPVWGYTLGAYDIIWSFLSPIGEMGIRVLELFGIENLKYPYHSATVVNPLFLSGIKAMLIICDLAVGYLIHREVKDATGNRNKADFAFSIWFLCPIVMYMCGVQCMFDTISALATLISVISVRRGYNVLGGAVMGIAILLKVLPAICLPLLLIYIIVKNKGAADMVRRSAGFIVSCIAICAVILIPDIIHNDMATVFSFATNRILDGGAVKTEYIFFAVIGVAFIALMAYLMNKNRSDLDKKIWLFVLCGLAVAVLATYVTNPQYCIVLIPFLAIYIATSDKGFMICWWVMTFAAAFKAAVMNNFGLLSMAAKYYGIADYNWIVSMSSIFDIEISPGWTLMKLLNFGGDLVYYVGLMFIIVFIIGYLFRERLPILHEALNLIKSIGRGKELKDES